MVGELKNFGAMVEKKAVEDKSYATNKELIKGHPWETIGGAMDDVERKNNLMGCTKVTEEELVLGILQELSPDNKKMWEDEEILNRIREIVREKFSGKKATTSDAEENVQPPEEISDAVSGMESEKTFGKKLSPSRWTEKNLTKVGRHARACKEDED